MRFVSLGNARVEEPEDLQAWLDELIVEINASIESAPTLQIERRVPTKPEEGRMYYFPKAHAPDIPDAGYYGYHAGNWVKLG